MKANEDVYCTWRKDSMLKGIVSLFSDPVGWSNKRYYISLQIMPPVQFRRFSGFWPSSIEFVVSDVIFSFVDGLNSTWPITKVCSIQTGPGLLCCKELQISIDYILTKTKVIKKAIYSVMFCIINIRLYRNVGIFTLQCHWMCYSYIISAN